MFSARFDSLHSTQTLFKKGRPPPSISPRVYQRRRSERGLEGAYSEPEGAASRGRPLPLRRKAGCGGLPPPWDCSCVLALGQHTESLRLCWGFSPVGLLQEGGKDSALHPCSHCPHRRCDCLSSECVLLSGGP